MPARKRLLRAFSCTFNVSPRYPRAYTAALRHTLLIRASRRVAVANCEFAVASATLLSIAAPPFFATPPFIVLPLAPELW